MSSPKTIIKSHPTEPKPIPDAPYLDVAEMFFDTIQGEGINIGHPAAFLRMQHCTMNCFWCDTQEVWRKGNPYTINELLDLMNESGMVRALSEGQHLVLTGGSPLLQQDRLVSLLLEFRNRFGFSPYTEIENECTIMPCNDIINLIHCWNNSPKLSNSGNLPIIRYQPNILKHLAFLRNSWFKFVIRDRKDWEEIASEYLDKGIINHNQIILMPVGGSRQELEANRERVVSVAIENNVRYCTREHVVLWDKLTGV